jgi:hypothetical protein
MEQYKLADISTKTMLLSVSFGRMGETRKAPNSLITNGAASAKVIKISKRLLESPELTAIRQADVNMRTRLGLLALPYSTSILLIPNELAEQVTQELEEYGIYRDGLIDTFIEAYPGLVKDAEIRLTNLASELQVPVSQLWVPTEYPSVEEVRARFTFEWYYFSFSVPEQLKLSGMAEAAQKKLDDKLEFAANEIVSMMRGTLHDMVSHLQEVLTPGPDGKPKRLHKTAITNIQGFLDTFKARNITNDTELDAVVEQAKELLKPDLDIDFLRKDDGLKTELSTGLGKLSEQLKVLVEITPGRKFKEID